MKTRFFVVLFAGKVKAGFDSRDCGSVEAAKERCQNWINRNALPNCKYTIKEIK